jgi:Skp family chaperone for outer membrane proteins
MMNIGLAIRFAAFLFIAVAGSSYGFSTSVSAQDAGTTIGVLDFDYVFRKSKAGSGLLASVNASQKKLDDEVVANGKKLREDEKKLQAECQKLSKEECEAKLKPFREKVTAVENDLNNKRKALEKRLTDGRNQITKALEPIVKDIIDKKKLQVVIDRGALFYAAESLNITEEALAALDAKLPKV